MHTQGGNSPTPWQKLLKFIANPTVEVIAAIVIMLVAAWVVIETESARKNPFPVLFGHK